MGTMSNNILNIYNSLYQNIYKLKKNTRINTNLKYV